MKKFLLNNIIICILTFFISAGYSQNTSNAINSICSDEVPVHIYHKYEKSGGRFTIFGPRYNKVDEKDPYSYFDPKSGRHLEIHRIVCTDKGWERCRRGHSSIAPINTSGVIVDGEAIYTIENEMLEQVDLRITEGEQEGNLMQRASISSQDGENIIFSFCAKWNGCNENGDGTIQIHIIDITHEMQTYLR